MTIHIDTEPFTKYKDALGLAINLTPNSQIRLQYLGGGVPFATVEWAGGGTPDAVAHLHGCRWLHDHGYVNAMVRLYAPQGDLPADPAAYIDSMVEPFQDWERGLVDAIAQLLNEWNNEYPAYPLPVLVTWGMAAMAQWRKRLPAKRIYMAGPAQDNRFLEYVASLDPLFKAADGIAIHYYFGRHLGDQEPGYEGSPEWWHERYPDKRIWVSECANWTDRDNVRYVYSRWMDYDWLDGFGDWKMSGDNDAEFNWTDDHTNVMAEVCREWRAVRSYPQGGTVVTPPSVPGVDIDALIAEMHEQWGIYQEMLAKRDRNFQEYDALAIRQFNSVVKVKQTLGVQ